MTDVNIEKMRAMALEGYGRAYAPYSQFQVGACVFSEDGRYFSGCNVENACYAMGQCAEATAIGNMISQGATKIHTILCVTNTDKPAAACGGCLQKISEFALPDTEVIFYTLSGKVLRQPFAQCFPQPYDKDCLDTLCQ